MNYMMLAGQETQDTIQCWQRFSKWVHETENVFSFSLQGKPYAPPKRYTLRVNQTTEENGGNAGSAVCVAVIYPYTHLTGSINRMSKIPQSFSFLSLPSALSNTCWLFRRSALKLFNFLKSNSLLPPDRHSTAASKPSLVLWFLLTLLFTLSLLICFLLNGKPTSLPHQASRVK